MTSPLNPNRTTRFEERTEIFQYSKDDDWLLASPAEVSPCNSLKFNQRRPENDAPQIPPPAQVPENEQNNDHAVDPDIERLMKEYENIARRDS